MTPAEFAILRDQVKQDEGFSAVPYDDATGQPLQVGDVLKGALTVGWGTNLSEGIPASVAADLLDQRLEARFAELTRRFPLVLTLEWERQIVLGNLAYNMGIPRLALFVKMWAALRAGDYEQAAVEMLESRWATQVGARATRLADVMRSAEMK